MMNNGKPIVLETNRGAYSVRISVEDDDLMVRWPMMRSEKCAGGQLEPTDFGEGLSGGLRGGNGGLFHH